MAVSAITAVKLLSAFEGVGPISNCVKFQSRNNLEKDGRHFHLDRSQTGQFCVIQLSFCEPESGEVANRDELISSVDVNKLEHVFQSGGGGFL